MPGRPHCAGAAQARGLQHGPPQAQKKEGPPGWTPLKLQVACRSGAGPYRNFAGTEMRNCCPEPRARLGRCLHLKTVPLDGRAARRPVRAGGAGRRFARSPRRHLQRVAWLVHPRFRNDDTARRPEPARWVPTSTGRRASAVLMAAGSVSTVHGASPITRHKVRGMWFNFSHERSAVFDEEIEWGDATSPIGATVEGKIEFDIYELAYEYAFLRRENLELWVPLACILRSLLPKCRRKLTPAAAGP